MAAAASADGAAAAETLADGEYRPTLGRASAASNRDVAAVQPNRGEIASHGDLVQRLHLLQQAKQDKLRAQREERERAARDAEDEELRRRFVATSPPGSSRRRDGGDRGSARGSGRSPPRKEKDILAHLYQAHTAASGPKSGRSPARAPPKSDHCTFSPTLSKSASRLKAKDRCLLQPHAMARTSGRVHCCWGVCF